MERLSMALCSIFCMAAFVWILAFDQKAALACCAAGFAFFLLGMVTEKNRF
jgi:hypothetical protein